MATGTRAEMHEEIMKRKQEEREMAKRVRMAKKELYVAPKKTRRSLGIIQIDPSGVLHFEDGRWMKVYRTEGGISHLPELIKKMKGNLIFTHKIEKKKDTYYLTIFQKGEVYESVRQSYKEDERVISEHITLRTLTVEQLVNEIRQMTGAYQEPFDYQTFISKRRDLLGELIPGQLQYIGAYSVQDRLLHDDNIVEKPIKQSGTILEGIRESTEKCVLSVSFRGLGNAELEEYMEYLYRIYEWEGEEIPRDLINCYANILVFGDERDRKQTNEKIEEAFLKDQYRVVPNFFKESECAKSIISLGMKEYGYYSQVLTKAAKKVFRKEYGYDSD